MRNNKIFYVACVSHQEQQIQKNENPRWQELRNDNNSLSKDYLEAGDLRLDIKNSKLSCHTSGEEIDISCKEFLLIEYLMYNHKQIISKEQIYDKVWVIDNDLESNNLEAYLSFLRKKK